MASFDPSIISQIPDYAPNPVAAKEKAFKLQDLIDTEKMNKLRLGAVETEAKERAQAKEILKGADYTTPAGVTATAEKLSRAGLGDKAMDFMSTAQKYQTGEIEKQIKQLELGAEQNGAIVGAIDPIVSKLEEYKANGATPAMLDAYAAAEGPKAAKALMEQRPELAQYVQKFMGSPGAFTYQGLKGAENQSKQGREAIKQRLDQFKADTAAKGEATKERAEDERERHDRAQEAAAAKRQTGFSDESSDLMAALAERGVSLPTGFRSKDQQRALYEGLLKRNPGKSADEIAEGIAKGQIEFGAQKKETQTAAGVAGKVEVAQNEIEQFAPLVREASAKVPRGNFMPVTKLLQAGEAQLSDPNLKELRIYINSILNAYDMLAARGGTDKDKRAQAHSLLTTADSPEALERGLKAFEKEAAAAHQAAVQATRVRELPESSGGAAPPKANDPLGIR